MKSSNSSGASARRQSASSRKSFQVSFVLLTADRIRSPVAGSLRIKTSFPSNRNSAGRRTAWLRPLRKSFAVFVAVVMTSSPLLGYIPWYITSVELLILKHEDPRTRHSLRHGRRSGQLPRLSRAQLDQVGREARG